MKNKLNKKQLKKEYCENKLIATEIAKKYNSNKKSVLSLLHKYNIPIIHTQRKYLDVVNLRLSNIQKEFIYGTLMGDGCIALHGRKNKKGRLLISQCSDQHEYTVWKYNIIKNFVSSNIKVRIDKKGYTTSSFTTHVHDEFTKIYNKFYFNSKKIITNKILQHLTPFSIAIWYMDDGFFYKKRNTCRIYTCSFSMKEHELIQKWFLNKYGIKCGIYLSKQKNRKSYLYLYITKKSTEKLFKLIKPYIIPLMRYKVDITNPQRLNAEHP